MIRSVIKTLSVIAVLAAWVLATADGCLISCNPSTVHTSNSIKEKPIEQLQAHPFRTYASRK